MSIEQDGPVERTVIINDRVVAIEQRGDGPLVVMVHSIGADCSIYSQVARRLAPDHSVLTFDMRGHGASGLGARTHPSIDILAQDLADLLEFLEIRYAHLVGQSIGAMTLLAFAARQPNWPGSLLVFDGVAYGGPQWDAQYTKRAAEIDRLGMAALGKDTVARSLGRTTRAVHPDLVHEYFHLLGQARPEGYAWGCRAMVALDLREALPAVRSSVLVAAGEEDELTSPEHAASIARLIPNSRLVTLPGSGHVPCLEVPDLMASTIRDWVRTHPKGPS